MKGINVRKLATLSVALLVGVLLGLTIINCESNTLIIDSVFLSVITMTDEYGQIVGGSEEDWCVDDDAGVQPPIVFAMYPAYPNPASGTTMIHFQVPRACHVKITIHNVYRGHVETLWDRDCVAQAYVVEWDASKYTSGLYWCYMEAEDFECSGRILILQ